MSVWNIIIYSTFKMGGYANSEVFMDINERNKSMRDFFDRKADGYDEVHQKFMATKNLIAQNLCGDIKNILDLGGGTGLELFAVFEKYPDACVTVVDISKGMLDMLSKRPFFDKITCICGNFLDVDFGSGYDAVISTSSLHHFLLPDKKRLYKKIYNCLAAGGVFINSDKTADTIEQEQQALDFYYQNKDVCAHCDTPLAVENEAAALVHAGFMRLDIGTTDQPDYKITVARKI